MIELMNYNDQDDIQAMQLRRGKSTGCTKIPQMDRLHTALTRAAVGERTSQESKSSKKAALVFFLKFQRRWQKISFSDMAEDPRMGQGHFGCAGQGDASTGVFGLMSR